MNVLILGSGGREHTFAWKISQSPLCSKVYIAPGNAGTQQHGINIAINPMDFEAVKQLVLDENIEMVIVGPEAPLVAGVYDFFKKDAALKAIPVIGPSAKGAQLEGSKAFSKAFMAKRNIPTAGYQEFIQATLQEGLTYIEQQTPPIVLKADGLAAGKGVLILDNIAEAKKEFTAMLDGKFGAASEKVVIEDFLDGIEFSVFVLTDGKDYKVLPIAKDYKRIGEGDTGLNTGGMGAVSPVPFVDATLYQKVIDRVVEPTVNGLLEEGIDYKGFIFLGLIEVDKEPYVIEYNCRMGDPETEVVLPRISSDLLPVLASLKDASLDEHEIEITDQAASTVMMVSGGYPGSYEKGKAIYIPREEHDSILFHAGTRMEGQQVLTNGGRVLAITSFGEDHKKAVEKSLDLADRIDFEGKYFRKDIGQDV